jgi:hypothetical protein
MALQLRRWLWWLYQCLCDHFPNVTVCFIILWFAKTTNIITTTTSWTTMVMKIKKQTAKVKTFTLRKSSTYYFCARE